MKIVYVAGKYSGWVDENIAKARKVAIELWEMGHAVICPHLNSAHMELDCKATWEDYLRGDLEIISRVDAVVMLEGWEDSKGAVMERRYALDNHIAVYYAPDYPECTKDENVYCPHCKLAFKESDTWNFFEEKAWHVDCLRESLHTEPRKY